MSDYYDNSYPMDANSGRNYGFHLNEPNVNHNYQSMPMYAMNEHSMDTNYSYPIAPNRAYNYRPSYSHNQSDYDYYERSYSPLSVKSYHGSSHWTPYATAGQFSYYETQRLYASQYTTHPYPPYPPTGAPPAAQMPPQSYGWIPTTVEEFELKPSQSLSSQSSFDEEIVSVANEPIDRKPTVAELQRFSAMNANRMTTPVIISANQAMSLLVRKPQSTPSMDCQQMVQPVVRRRRGSKWRQNMTYEEIRAEKRESNRLAALRCRLKKLQTITALEMKADEIRDDNTELEVKLKGMRRALETSKMSLICHRLSDCPLGRGGQPLDVKQPKQEPIHS